MTPEYKQTLRESIDTAFSLVDLQTLTFDLGIDWEHLAGAEKREKLLSLITYLENRGLMSELIALLRKERPNKVWDDPPIIEPPIPPEEPNSFDGSRKHHSCFISHSSQDHEFAERLNDSLKMHGVSTWFAPHDLKIGSRMRRTFDENVLKKNKLLLILSKDSMGSSWVEQEVETALARERRDGSDMLFPVRIDDAILNAAIEAKLGWPAYVSHTRHIGDFRQWANEGEYQKALGRLLRDLQI